MNYTLKGRLLYAICDEHEKAIQYTTVRLYSLQEEVNAATAYTAAQSKELIQVFEEKEIKNRKKFLLAETQTDAEGNYEFKINGDKSNYSGGAVAVTLFYKEVPEYGQQDTKLPKRFRPFEVLLDVVQPKWRETNAGLVAGWNYHISKRIWCYILSRLDIWVICGKLTNCESKQSLAGIEVIAMDDDIITDDLLGSAVTDSNGRFCIYYRSIDFKKTFLSPWINVETTPIFSFDNGPDIYFKYAVGGNEFFAESPSEAQKPSRKNVGNCLCVQLCLKDAPQDDPTVPVSFYNIGYARKYHPILNIDPATGRTTGKANAGLNEQAFYSNLDLRGSLNKKFNGQPAEYKFQYAEVVNPNTDVGTISAGSWVDVTPNDIATTQLGERLFQTVPFNLYHTYTIHGTGLTTIFGTDFKVEFDGNWIKVPQYNGSGNDIAFNGSLIKLKSAKLAAGSVDKSTLTQGNSSAPLEKNRYFALRMLKREAGNDASIVMAGFSRPLAIFNKTYLNVPQGGSWLPTPGNPELGIASVDLQELATGGGCSKVGNTINVKYTAANPNLGDVSLNFTGPGASNSFSPIVYPSPGEEAHGTSQYTGNFGALENCAYEIRLNAALKLTNGETQHQGIWDRVIFCR